MFVEPPDHSSTGIVSGGPTSTKVRDCITVRSRDVDLDFSSNSVGAAASLPGNKPWKAVLSWVPRVYEAIDKNHPVVQGFPPKTAILTTLQPRL